MARPSRKLTLAVGDPALRQELRALLKERDVEVEFVPELDADALQAGSVDVVVVRSEDLRDRVLDTDRGVDAPGVVVLGDESPVEEARLVAAGASAVVDDEQPAAKLTAQLVELAEAEAHGGLTGPEAAGAQADPRLVDFQSQSPRMQSFIDLVRRVAESDSTLLVTGETGVGKERLARAIHAESSRSNKPFVTVNCGALPENLLESELFGHERGAFTGATAVRRGRFEEADGGTLFLDEIGEMPLHLQVKLLTVLQRREVRRLGSEAPRTVDVRILSATNRDLAEAVAAGEFREDLLFRLNVVALEIPPLRERREDLPQFIGRFLRHFVEAHERPEVTGVDEAAMRALLDHDWPGNVRELVNVVERAVLLCRGERIALVDLPDSVTGRAGPVSGSSSSSAVDEALFAEQLPEARRRVVEDFERRYLAHALEAARGVVGTAAARAGINPRTLYEKMRRYGLRKEDFS